MAHLPFMDRPTARRLAARIWDAIRHGETYRRDRERLRALYGTRKKQRGPLDRLAAQRWGVPGVMALPDPDLPASDLPWDVLQRIAFPLYPPEEVEGHDKHVLVIQSLEMTLGDWERLLPLLQRRVLVYAGPVTLTAGWRHTSKQGKLPRGPQRPRPDAATLARLRDLHQQGLPLKAIADELGKHIMTVSRYCKMLGLSRRSTSRS